MMSHRQFFFVNSCLDFCFFAHLCQEVHQSERHGEGAEEDVGDGEVGDEDVPRG